METLTDYGKSLEFGYHVLLINFCKHCCIITEHVITNFKVTPCHLPKYSDLHGM